MARLIDKEEQNHEEHDPYCSRRAVHGSGGAGAAGSATAPADTAIPVTVENFTCAESDRYFAVHVQQSGGALGTFHHGRAIASVDHQPVARYNRDVL
jgi:hypothetical protein